MKREQALKVNLSIFETETQITSYDMTHFKQHIFYWKEMYS
jgi:hypothetical protein